MKALLVSTTPSHTVQDCLLAAASNITVAQNGQDAVRYVEHGSFDMAVIVSTGEYMDLLETYLNIRELKPTMEIVLLSQTHVDDEDDRTVKAIATAFAKTHALTLDGLSKFLQGQRHQLE